MKMHISLKTFWETSIDHNLESGYRNACFPVVLTHHTLKPHKVTEVTLKKLQLIQSPVTLMVPTAVNHQFNHLSSMKVAQSMCCQVYVNLIQARAIGEEGGSTEKIPL